VATSLTYSRIVVPRSIGVPDGAYGLDRDGDVPARDRATGLPRRSDGEDVLVVRSDRIDDGRAVSTRVSIVHGERFSAADAKARLERWRDDVDARQVERDAVIVAVNRAIRAYRLGSGDAYALEVTVEDVNESTLGIVSPEGAFRGETGDALSPDRPRSRRPSRLEVNQAGEAVGLGLGFGDRFLEGEELLVVAGREHVLGRERSARAALIAGAGLIVDELAADPTATNARAVAVSVASGPDQDDDEDVVDAARRLQVALDGWRRDLRAVVPDR